MQYTIYYTVYSIYTLYCTIPGELESTAEVLLPLQSGGGHFLGGWWQTPPSDPLITLHPGAYLRGTFPHPLITLHPGAYLRGTFPDPLIALHPGAHIRSPSGQQRMLGNYEN